MSDLDNVINQLLEFVSHLNQIFVNIKVLENITSETNDQRLIRIKKLNDSIDTTTNFNYLLKNKIKLFSHKEKDTLKISESLFGSELSLKKIFNNQEETIKLVLWKDLQNILLSYNEYLLLSNPDDKLVNDKVNKLKNNIESINTVETLTDPKESINKILNTSNLNETTNEMINDIFTNFESILNNKDENSNPFGNILEISKTITEKYKDKIENGDIKLDDLLKNMTHLPGMENMGNIVEMLTKQFTSVKEQPKEPVIIDENFSTATIEQGNVTEDKPGLNVASLLKTMDSLGLNNGNGQNGPDLSKIMGIFNKLGDIKDPSQLNNVVQNELGIDLNKFSEEISKTLKK